MTAPVSPLAGAKVVSAIDPSRVAINRGTAHGVRLGQRFLIYALGGEMTDPDTNESLGRIEIVRGTGKVTHVQEKLATLTSDRVRQRRVHTRMSFIHLGDSDETISEEVPFDEAERGDLARPI